MRTLLAALTCLSLCACFYPADRGRLLETRVDQLQAKNEALQAQQDELTSLAPALDAKIAEVTAALKGLDQASRRSGADIGVQLQKTVEDVALLRGQIDLYQHRVQSLEEALAGLPAAPAGGPGGTQPPPTAQAPLERPKEKKAFLALAEQKAKEDVPLARTLFEEFLQKWPKDPLAASAHFGLGETYFREKKCREALFEYGKVIQGFSKASVAPAAYLHSSDCFAQLKMKREAELALEELVRGHPKSKEAVEGKKKLAELQRPAAKKATPKKKK